MPENNQKSTSEPMNSPSPNEDNESDASADESISLPNLADVKIKVI